MKSEIYKGPLSREEVGQGEKIRPVTEAQQPPSEGIVSSLQAGLLRLLATEQRVRGQDSAPPKPDPYNKLRFG
ncbi:MAG: hypothetical protein O2840_02715 [bacterium]|nr:hypothetical protein [bacterium]